MSILRKRSKNDSVTEYNCSIRFLDDSETIQLTFKKDTLGLWLFDRVCEKLNLVEKDYFGLRYVDPDNQRHWLDPLKSVYKQLKDFTFCSFLGLGKMVLSFRVKFYPEDPMKLHEEITRYYLFLQLRRDLHHGRLLCSSEDSVQLAAYIIQSELGDYDPYDHPLGYVANFKMLLKQTLRHEEKIMDAHKALSGAVPSECESKFLKKAAAMETYGVDPHEVKDHGGNPLYLGVTHSGIMTFRGNRRTRHFKWNQIKRLAYEGKMFIINYSSPEEEESTNSNSKKKYQAVGYKCLTAAAAKYLWRCSVEQQLFFTLSSSATAPKVRSGGTLFSRGSKFRFSGRCQNEAYEASGNIHRAEPPFARTSSLPNFTKKNIGHKTNSVREPNTSASFREDRRQFNVYLAKGRNKEEAAVDVPRVVNEIPVVATRKSEVLEQIPKVQAPLAQVEAFEEKLQQSSIAKVEAPISTPTPPPTPSEVKEEISKIEFQQPFATSTLKENGQVVRDTSGILETSLDEYYPYEPNQTLDESDEENKEEVTPCLDEEINRLEEAVIQPTVKKDLSAPPQQEQTTAPQAVKPQNKKSCVGVVVKSFTLSLFILFLLSIITFYVVFFSPVKHPFISQMRDHLHFLEPVKDLVQETAIKAVNYFKK